jgi:hypothetical protein
MIVQYWICWSCILLQSFVTLKEMNKQTKNFLNSAFLSELKSRSSYWRVSYNDNELYTSTYNHKLTFTRSTTTIVEYKQLWFLSWLFMIHTALGASQTRKLAALHNPVLSPRSKLVAKMSVRYTVRTRMKRFWLQHCMCVWHVEHKTKIKSNLIAQNPTLTSFSLIKPNLI